VLEQVHRLESRVVEPLTEYGTSCRQAKVCQPYDPHTSICNAICTVQGGQ